MLDPLVATAISIGFGIMFLLGAVHKLTALAEFRAILADYRLLPAKAVDSSALAVIGAEACLGLGWLFAPETRVVASATAILLLVYAAAIAVNLRRGRTHISCGCGFGQFAGGVDLLSGWLVARNLLLVAVAALGSLPAAERTFGALDYVTLAAALATSMLLFVCANQLIQNRAAIASWRRGAARDE